MQKHDSKSETFIPVLILQHDYTSIILPCLLGSIINNKDYLIRPWINNHIHYKVWDEITYPFPNFNSATVEVWEWISNLIAHFMIDVITYLCWY